MPTMPASPPAPDSAPEPIRAALRRLVELNNAVLHDRPGWEMDWADAIGAARAVLDAHPVAPPPSGPRRFASLTRTVETQRGFTVLDAIDTDGRAWWLVLGNDAAPDGWTELDPLPTYEDQP